MEVPNIVPWTNDDVQTGQLSEMMVQPGYTRTFKQCRDETLPAHLALTGRETSLVLMNWMSFKIFHLSTQDKELCFLFEGRAEPAVIAHQHLFIPNIVLRVTKQFYIYIIVLYELIYPGLTV